MRVAGIVRHVDVGCRVYSTIRHRVGPGGEPDPIGGLVVAVTEKLNDDTGEVDRAFLTFDDQRTRPRLQWHTLLESEVDRDLIEAVDIHTLANAWRRLAEEITYSKPRTRRRGPATAEEVRCAEAIRDLQAVVFGPEGVLYGTLQQLAPGKAVGPRPEYPPAPGGVFVD